MGCSDVIVFIVITRRHVGGMLSVNKTQLKCGNLKIITQSRTVVFRLAYNCPRNMQLASKHTKIYDVHHCNNNTSNMAAVTIVNRMT